MFRKVVLLVVLSAFALSACAGTPAAAPEDPTLKIAVLPILDALPMYAAEAQGYYAAAGIKVEFVPVASAAERDQVMQAGQVDGMINDLTSTVLYNKDTQKIAVVRFARIALPDSAQFSILASKASGITSADQLKGVEIGISQGTVIEYLTQRVLENAGLSTADIKTTNIPKIPDRLQMLAEGQLKAATLPEPAASLAVQSGSVLVISDASLPSVGTSEFSFSINTLKAKPETVKKFLAALEKATVDVNTTPEKFNTLLTDKKLVPAPLIGKYQLPKFPAASVPSEAQLKDVQAWMIEKGLIKAEVAYNKLVDASYLPK
ncbi:MAG: ABC transporter substrate-binding protein [Thermoflexales bacterium]|nr:ABC transporter substrate-binding protein [Thermoflexales bacterium]